MLKDHSRSPTIALLVLVYQGGQYWEECWESVKDNQIEFDEVIIGFNYSHTQSQDFSFCAQGLAKHTRTFFQKETISFVKHLSWLIDKVQSDYVLFLCHDDVLIKAGIKELKQILSNFDSHIIGVFGSYEWSYPDRIEIKKELESFGNKISLNDFIIKDAIRYLSFNLSGLVGHVNSIKANLIQSENFSDYGFRFDNWMLTQRNVKYIYQTIAPIVRVRVHDSQLGQSKVTKERSLDNITYYFITALYTSSPELRRICINRVFSHLMEIRFFEGFLHMFALIKASLGWGEDKQYFLPLIECIIYATTVAPKKITKRWFIKK